MFGKQNDEPASATILADGVERPGWNTSSNMMSTYEFAVEVHPNGRPAFRTKVRGRFDLLAMPEKGMQVKVRCNPAKRSAELDVDHDIRFDLHRQLKADDRKHAVDQAAAAAAPVGTAIPEEPPAPRLPDGIPELAKAYVTHVGELTATGIPATMDITASSPSEPAPRVLELVLSGIVHPPSGEPYAATFTMFRMASTHTPEQVGDTMAVLIDPDDPTDIVHRPPNLQPRVIWKVPAECPHCGAAIDQSTASTVAHPSCPFCGQPVPVEPA